MRQRAIAMWVIAAPILAGAAWWAFKPADVATPAITRSESSTEDTQPTALPTQTPDNPIDPNTFAIKLWNPLTPPVEPTAVAKADEPPPKPLHLQLIGIITEGSGESQTLRAALYDVDEDRLLIIADGERIRDRTVHILPGGLVELTDGQNTQRLMLRPDKEASS